MLVLLPCVLVLTAQSSSLAAEPPAPLAAERIGRALDEIDATPAQREAIGGVFRESGHALAELRDEAIALRDRARSLAATDAIDREAAEELRLDAVDLFDRASAAAVALWIEIHDQLSAEQRAALHAHRQQRLDHLRSLFAR